MKNKYINQLAFEVESWKRIFDFMENETVFMKGRMSQILRELSDTDLLNHIEVFQNQFLTQDKVIRIFRNDIDKQSQSLLTDEISPSVILEKLNRQKKLRKEISLADKEFDRLKMNFYEFFCENLTEDFR